MTVGISPSPSLGHPIASRDQWLAQRKALLAREKELTRLNDEIAQERRALPWVRVEKHYVFATLQGPRTLAELFAGRRQLVVQHFMFAPGATQGCAHCSYMADHSDGANLHLGQRDIQLVAVSRAPLPDIERFRQRMGWKFDWVSCDGNGFNNDFGTSFTEEQMAQGAVDYNYQMQPFPQQDAPGISVFAKGDAGEVYHTYSRYGRGVEVMMGAYVLMDLTPQGRDEDGMDYGMQWVRHHDRYEQRPVAAAHACCTPLA